MQPPGQPPYGQYPYPQQPAPQAMNPYGVPAPAYDTRHFVVTLRKHTGMLVIMQTRTYRVQGTLAQCEAAYHDAQTHNLLAGWWGLFSFLFMNWIAIIGNMSAIAEVRKLAASAQPPQFNR
jgi:hypothetical protein